MAEPLLDAAWWDQRYRDGGDGWELGEPAPPLRHFLESDLQAPQPPGRVLVPGCGRGHEAALLAGLGFAVVGLDLSAAALREARRCHGDGSTRICSIGRRCRPVAWVPPVAMACWSTPASAPSTLACVRPTSL
jgi:SAM-dependent methyltransferase